MERIVRIEGIIPPYMMTEILRRNPELRERMRHTRSTTHSMLNDRLNKKLILPHVIADARREVYDAQDGEERPGSKARFEGEAPTGEHDVDLAYDFTGDVRKFYHDIHDLNSIDGRGMDMISVVHFREGFNNAFWDGQIMTYGRGDQKIFQTFMKKDICGHEITHGVTQFQAQMLYYGQSGALNESISDVFGKLIEMYADKVPVDKFNWVIGPGMFAPGVDGRGIRDMLNPGTAYKNKLIGQDPQPAHMNKYMRTQKDKGGVHVNSGIPNRAFALFAIALGGWAWDKAGQIWYAARAAAGNQPSFGSFAFHTVEASRKLGFSGTTDKLVKAWAAVGVTPSETAADDLTPPRPLTPTQPGASHGDDHSH